MIEITAPARDYTYEVTIDLGLGKHTMMDGQGFMGFGMVFGGFGMIAILVLIVLTIFALIKYLRS